MEKISKRFKTEINTIITCNDFADAGSFGSLIAASKIFKNSLLFWPNSNEENLQNFVEIKKKTLNLNLITHLNKVPTNDIERVVIVDTSVKERLLHLGGELIEKVEKGEIKAIIFDNHPQNEEKDLKGITHRKAWGSTCSLLVDEIKRINESKQEEKIELTKEEATIIAIGIYEDTGAFLFAGTQSEDLKSMAYLKSNYELDLLSMMRFFFFFLLFTYFYCIYKKK